MAYYCAKLFSMKTKFGRVLLVLSLYLHSQLAGALSLEEVSITDVSTSGESMIADLGDLEEYKEGLQARFYVQKGPKETPVIFLVAEGELVKSLPRKSYWSLKTIHLPDQLKKASKLLMMTDHSVSMGRPLRIKTRHRVVNKDEYGDVDAFLADNEENVPRRLVHQEDQYDASEKLFDEDPVPEADIEISTYEGYRNKSETYYSEEYGDKTDQRYFLGNRTVRVGDIKKAEDKKLLDSMGEGHEQKVASMKYGVKDFYRDQEKLPDMREFNKAVTIKSSYEQAREDKKAKAEISPRVIAKKQRDGENWTADLDSASLRKYFIQTGVESEMRRRELALSELDGHEIMIHYSGSMVNQTTDADSYYQGRGYHLGLGYDLHLSRSNPEWKNWSLQFILERGVVDLDIGGRNGRSEEGFVGGYINYYFVHNPLTLNRFIYLAGLGLKVGSSDMSAPELSKDYSYQVLTLPSMQLMTKYRFRTGDLAEDTVNVGASANFGINADVKNYNSSDGVSDDINGKFSKFDLKYYLGMSIYF